MSLFARVEGLAATAKEEGDMGVFLGLGNTQLLLVLFGQILAQELTRVSGG